MTDDLKEQNEKFKQLLYSLHIPQKYWDDAIQEAYVAKLMNIDVTKHIRAWYRQEKKESGYVAGYEQKPEIPNGLEQTQYSGLISADKSDKP